MSKKIVRDCESAREKFQAFEFAYHVMRPDDLRYLREQSSVYKRAVMAVQELILPAVRKNCPHCPYGTCCRLSSPELSIYIAGSVGCFNLTDYLLTRCGCELPEPNFANNRRNLCAFWDNDCRLQPDCRSLLCLQFFCEPLRRDLDMDLVNKRVAAAQSVVNNFSIGQLLQKQHR
ncbi:MAG: hypothetical protein NTW95_14125 [Candidatus Aminicenantes bacterium]|nr:hypothetical protein [Candidatus Aminicenantes bacterium]